MSTLPITSPDVGTSLPNATRGRSASLWARVVTLIQGRLSYALADQVVYSFGNMAVAALLSRHGSATDFGVYILTQRSMDVLIQLCNVFLWAPFTFQLPKCDPLRARRYQGSIVFLQCWALLVFTGLLALAARWTAGPAHKDLHATFLPLIASSGAILFREFTRRMYFAHLRLVEAFWTESATVALQVTGVYVLFRRGQLDVSHTLYVLGFAAGLVSLWWLVCEWRRWQVAWREVLLDLRRDFQLGRWFFGSNMVFLATSQCNPWVLNAVLGGSAVGSYAIAESLVNIPRVALTSMQNMMGPTLARAEAEGGKRQVALVVRRLNKGLLIGSALCAAVILLFGPRVAQLIYHQTPVHTRAIAFWLALNLVVYAGTLAQSYGLTALGRADLTFLANGLGLIAQACVCLVLVHTFKVPGAAMAMLVGSVAVLLARQWSYSREVRSC